MKKILGLILVFTLSFSSCKDYLTIVPSDAMFLEDVQALKQTLASWLYNYREVGKYNSTDAPAAWLQHVISAKYQSYPDIWSFSNWENMVSLNEKETEKRYVARAENSGTEWANHYAIIGMMNLILNEIDDAAGEEDMRNYVKGEALIHRAFSFFKLLQYYSPMNDASLGVPVYLDTYGGFADADLSRKNQKVVYDRIFADLAEAERLLAITEPNPTYNKAYNYDCFYRILSEIYQWKACGPVAEETDWSSAANAAKKAIAQADNSLPWNITKMVDDFFGNASATLPPTSVYPEAAFCKFSGGVYTNFGYDLETWKTLYAYNDNRKYIWFGLTEGMDPDLVQEKDLDPSKKIRGFYGGYFRPQWYFRLSEQYLILIEAYAHTDFNEGLRVLRQWQSVRYSGDGSDWVVPSNAEALLNEVRLERKRELLYDGDLLWLDMKRYNFTDSGRSVLGYNAPPMTSYDIRYNFKIPSSETDTNANIKRNPGWEKYETMD